jgi:hypothetical protein
MHSLFFGKRNCGINLPGVKSTSQFLVANSPGYLPAHSADRHVTTSIKKQSKVLAGVGTITASN